MKQLRHRAHNERNACVRGMSSPLAGAVWHFRITVPSGSSINTFASFKNSCTKDLASCNPSTLLRKIDTVRFGPHVRDNMLGDIVHTRLNLLYHVDVFQRDRQCLIVWVVKFQKEFSMMSIPHMNHESSVVFPILPPSSTSSSSSRSRFLFAVDDGLG